MLVPALCNTGEKIVIRILNQSGLSLDLMDLGFDADTLDLFSTEINKPWGMIYITGTHG